MNARYYRWSGTAAEEARYYRWCGTAAMQARYYRRMPSSIVSYHMLIHICCVYLVLIVPSSCFVCPCVWFQVMNILSSKSAVSTPGVQRQSGTAHLSLQVVHPVLHRRQWVLPQVLILFSRRRLPTGKKVTEMIAKEFWDKRRRNPYEEDQEPNLVNRPFWNRF